MKVIIAGSRTITDKAELEKALKDANFYISEVVCGGAAGPDTLGKEWAQQNIISIKYFLPDWKTHGKAAGPIRNSEMIKYADALIALYDGISKGTNDTIKKATKKGLKVHVHLVKMEKKV